MTCEDSSMISALYGNCIDWIDNRLRMVCLFTVQALLAIIGKHYCMHASKSPVIYLKSIYDSPFKDSHSNPIHICFPIITSNEVNLHSLHFLVLWKQKCASFYQTIWYFSNAKLGSIHMIIMHRIFNRNLKRHWL